MQYSPNGRERLHFPDMFSTFALTYWNHGKCKFILDWTNVGNSREKRISRYLLASYPSVDMGVGCCLFYPETVPDSST